MNIVVTCCKETFAGLGEVADKDRVRYVVERHADGECEATSVGSHQMGCVNDTEALVRLCLDPLHINDQGELNPTAADDVYKHGLSITRCSLTDENALGAQIQQKADLLAQRESANEVADAVLLVASEVRALQSPEDGCQAFAIYDTSLDENRAHAEIFGASMPPKGIRRSLREDLIRLMNNGLIGNLNPKVILECAANPE